MKKIIYTIAIVFALSSCSDFLDEVPKGSLTTESYYKTEKHAEAATNAIYDYLIIGYAPGGLWDSNYGGVFYNDYWVLQDLFADNSETQMTSVDFTSISNMRIDPYNSSVRLLWRDYYQTIKTCNVVLDEVPAIPMNEVKKKHLLAEARFFRAMMYFDLVRMFGDVPLHTANVESASDQNTPRVNKKIIYDQIISDLEIAEKDLVYAARTGGGRPYPLSASALLARVYLTYGAQYKDKGAFQKAVNKAQSVIPSFPLLSNYADIFKIPNRFNTEVIWGTNFSASLSEGWKGGQFLVRLLPSLDTSLGGPENAHGWETATENLNASYLATDTRKNVTLRNTFVYNDNSVVNLPHSYVFKYWDRQTEPKGNNTDAIFPAIRTAEMYLIVAEALNEINNSPTPEAIAALHTIRTRAGIGSQPIASDYKGFKNDVLKERRAEFVMEGQRWFDLTRMCTPQEFKDLIKAAKPNATPQDYHFLFPIPQEEIQLSHGLLTQNPGYSQ